MLKTRLVVAVLAALLAAMPSAVMADFEQNDFLKRAVFADGKLWVLSERGHLFRLEEGQASATRVELPEAVIDICVKGGHPLAITGASKAPGRWTLRTWEADRWTVGSVVKSRGDRLIAADCRGPETVLLSSRRLTEVRPDRVRSVRVNEELSARVVTSVYGTRDFMFVGLNRGEWGGGFRRIDRRTGKVALIEESRRGLCEGALNMACDPVNGIVAEPWKPGCVLAAVGLVHFFPHGRLVEICGDQVRALYSKPYMDGFLVRSGSDGANSEPDENPFSTVAFFGLASGGDSVWAAGIDGLYRVGADGVTKSPLPEFKEVSGFHVAFLPELILVLTSINQRASVSGPVPMIVAR